MAFYFIGFSLQETIFYATVISMIDPVSIISIFESLPISKGLYSSLFGESIFTNGVAIILYEVLLEYMHNKEQTTTKVFTAIASFVMILLGSFIVGTVGGFFTAYMLKRFHWAIAIPNKKKLNTLEAGIMTVSPIAIYLIAMTFEFSGLVTILITGLILSQYAAENLSFQTRRVLKLLYQGTSYICRATTFIFLGLCAVNNYATFDKVGELLIVGNILIVILSRLLSVLLCSFISDFNKKWTLEYFKKKIVLWYSGLRGTLTYLLALRYTNDFQKSNGNAIVILTLSFSLFTVL